MPLTRLDESNISLKSALLNIACVVFLYLDYVYFHLISNKTLVLCTMLFFGAVLLLGALIDIINIVKGLLDEHNSTE